MNSILSSRRKPLTVLSAFVALAALVRNVGADNRRCMAAAG